MADESTKAARGLFILVRGTWSLGRFQGFRCLLQIVHVGKLFGI
jgi:hypothetical protein